MQKNDLFESVGKYIDKYYVPKTDDIRMDMEMKSIFQRLAEFRKRREAAKSEEIQEEVLADDYEIDESVLSEFDVSSMQKTKVLSTMSNTMAANRIHLEVYVRTK